MGPAGSARTVRTGMDWKGVAGSDGTGSVRVGAQRIGRARQAWIAWLAVEGRERQAWQGTD